MLEAIIWCVFGVILMVVCSIIAYKGFKLSEADEYGPDGPMAMAVFVGILPCAVGILMFCINIFTVVQIWVAPKVYLIEYIVKLVKN